MSRTGETLLDVNISEESLKKKKKLGESRRPTNLPFFDIRTLATATDNFSATNKLGEGGFGSVFKVITLKQREGFKNYNNSFYFTRAHQWLHLSTF